ncbi:hypothetical protein QVD17_10947 [Tagetes erecta]|uniref:Uncharacterized protein n=1 Tax=Tagetes erecta TaxID=13708 RepID=A0AAD8P6E2_TARER|nr:hypothetical protein QVD17_10947 [Tagetes erecta]
MKSTVQHQQQLRFQHGTITNYDFKFRLQQANNSFKLRLNHSMVAGDTVLFWHDWWIGDKSLKGMFSNLYNHEKNKRYSVRDRVEWDSNRAVWRWIGYGHRRWVLKRCNFKCCLGYCRNLDLLIWLIGRRGWLAMIGLSL